MEKVLGVVAPVLGLVGALISLVLYFKNSWGERAFRSVAGIFYIVTGIAFASLAIYEYTVVNIGLAVLWVVLGLFCIWSTPWDRPNK